MMILIVRFPGYSSGRNFFPSRGRNFGTGNIQIITFQQFTFWHFFRTINDNNNDQVLLKILPYNVLTAIKSYKRFFLVFSGLQVLLQKMKRPAIKSGAFIFSPCPQRFACGRMTGPAIKSGA